MSDRDRTLRNISVAMWAIIAMLSLLAWNLDWRAGLLALGVGMATLGAHTADRMRYEDRRKATRQ